jgi:hypothetical protein
LRSACNSEPLGEVAHSSMVFVECVLEKYDAPIDLILGGHAIANTDYRARGPSPVHAQIPFPAKTRGAEIAAHSGANSL